MQWVQLLLVCLFTVNSLAQPTGSSPKPSPPPTRRESTQEVLHGVTVTDSYRWLEDQNSPETRMSIDAQNAHTHKLLDAWPGRPALEKRLTELRKVESMHSPVERNGRFLYRKRTSDQEQYVIDLREGLAVQRTCVVRSESIKPRPLHERGYFGGHK